MSDSSVARHAACAAPVEAVREQAMAAAVEFLKVDDRFQCDMLDLQCVQPLLTFCVQVQPTTSLKEGGPSR